MAGTIDTVVTFLEMNARPTHLHFPAPANLKLLLLKAEKPPVHYYRYLYDSVGRGLYWVDRKRMRDEALAAAIHAEGVDIYVLHVGGVPAGYFEVAVRGEGTTELAYFGLIADFHGLGLGKWFLSEAVNACWTSGEPSRVTVETCTLDGAAALPLYQRMGFEPYDRKDKTMVLPEGFRPEM